MLKQSKIIKGKDQNGDTFICGACHSPNLVTSSDEKQALLQGRNIYKFKKRKSKLYKGNLCAVKLCENIADTNFGKVFLEGQRGFYAIKRFNKLTLKKNKQYLKKPDGFGMLIWT